MLSDVSVGDSGARYGAKRPTTTKTTRIASGIARTFRLRSSETSSEPGRAATARPGDSGSAPAPTVDMTGDPAGGGAPRLIALGLRSPAGCADRPAHTG